MKLFNINDNVKVKLTELGRLVYLNYQRQFVSNAELPEPDENGYHEFQMWVLMSIFGQSMYNGGAIPFEGVHILIREQDLTEWES